MFFVWGEISKLVADGMCGTRKPSCGACGGECVDDLEDAGFCHVAFSRGTYQDDIPSLKLARVAAWRALKRENWCDGFYGVPQSKQDELWKASVEGFDIDVEKEETEGEVDYRRVIFSSCDGGMRLTVAHGSEGDERGYAEIVIEEWDVATNVDDLKG